MRQPRLRSFFWGACLIASQVASHAAAEEAGISPSFAEILESAGIGNQALNKLGQSREPSQADWQLLFQIIHRYKQFSGLPPVTPAATSFPEVWRLQPENCLGEIFELEGRVTRAVKVSPSDSLVRDSEMNSMYNCEFHFSEQREDSASSVVLLSTAIPNGWQSVKRLNEPVRVRGVMLRSNANGFDGLPLVLTNHLAWFPTTNASSGQLLLARQGMDVALLDEVRHRRPFVKPAVSREGEAFYAALQALGKAEPEEILNAARNNVDNAALQWQARQPNLTREHQRLEAELAAGVEDSRREKLQREIKQAKTQRGLAAAVIKSAESGLSSVAPMFLQPELETGELVIFEGTARRAVKIAAENQPAIDSYYEVEVFTNDSQNLPVVCCMSQIPSGFPTGDEIREPVRVAGVFFKSWQHRTRQLVDGAGQTEGQRRLYTPLVIGHSPSWLQAPSPGSNRWALLGGVVFLSGLALLWLGMIRLARRDRQARTDSRSTETINL